MIPAVELLLCIERAYVNASVRPSFRQSMILREGMETEYSNASHGKSARKALNRWDQTHFFRMPTAWKPNTVFMTSRDCSKSFITFHIDCLRPISSICQLFLIQRAIVTDRNLTVSPIRSPCIFSRYLKLSHVPTSLRLVLCCLIYATPRKVIAFSLFCRTSYKTESPK